MPSLPPAWGSPDLVPFLGFSFLAARGTAEPRSSLMSSLANVSHGHYHVTSVTDLTETKPPGLFKGYQFS